MELWETDVRKTSALRYLIAPAPADATLLTLEVYVPDSILRRMMFKLRDAEEAGALLQELSGQSGQAH